MRFLATAHATWVDLSAGREREGSNGTGLWYNIVVKDVLGHIRDMEILLRQLFYTLKTQLKAPNQGYLLPLSLSLCHKGASYEILAVPGTLTDAAANKS